MGRGCPWAPQRTRGALPVAGPLWPRVAQGMGLGVEATRYARVVAGRVRGARSVTRFGGGWGWGWGWEWEWGGAPLRTEVGWQRATRL